MLGLGILFTKLLMNNATSATRPLLTNNTPVTTQIRASATYIHNSVFSAASPLLLWSSVKNPTRLEQFTNAFKANHSSLSTATRNQLVTDALNEQARIAVEK